MKQTPLYVTLVLVAFFSFISAGYAEETDVRSLNYRSDFTPSAVVGGETVQVENNFNVYFEKAYNPYFKKMEAIHLGFVENGNPDECAIYPKENIFFANSLSEAEVIDQNMKVGKAIELNCTATGYKVEIRIVQKTIIDQYAYSFGFHFYKNENPLGFSVSQPIIVNAK